MIYNGMECTCGWEAIDLIAITIYPHDWDFITFLIFDTHIK